MLHVRKGGSWERVPGVRCRHRDPSQDASDRWRPCPYASNENCYKYINNMKPHRHTYRCSAHSTSTMHDREASQKLRWEWTLMLSKNKYLDDNPQNADAFWDLEVMVICLYSVCAACCMLCTTCSHTECEYVKSIRFIFIFSELTIASFLYGVLLFF
jgi:hypothetical protein